jgi:hypothetical protein
MYSPERSRGIAGGKKHLQGDRAAIVESDRRESDCPRMIPDLEKG